MTLIMSLGRGAIKGNPIREREKERMRTRERGKKIIPNENRIRITSEGQEQLGEPWGIF